MRSSRKTNLFVIGAMKSGSTSLHYYLADHPEIFMCEPKEPWYFVKEKNWHKGEDWYASLFAEAGDDVRYLGESSADYTMMPKFQGVPERIAAYNPEARFIYVLRDPVQRSISHYWHNVRWHGERRDLLAALHEDPDLVDFSNYHLQLATFRKIFPAERFYVLSFEEMVARPEETMARMFTWLGVDAAFVPPSLGQEKNVTPATVPMVRGLGLLHRLRHSRAWDRVHRFFPASLKGLGNKMATRDVVRKEQPVRPAIVYLRPRLQAQVEPLCELLGRSFPEWTTLFGA